jgi:hypothetical protein
MDITRQWLSNNISVETNMHTTTEEPLEVVFSMWPLTKVMYEDQQQFG